MNILIAMAFLLGGFILLVKGADWLVDGAASLARQYNVSELIIGLTIVAFGTSAPELMVNVLSSINGYNGVAYGNVIGSNIFNLLFILGISGVLYPLAVQRQTIRYEIPISLMVSVILLLLVNDTLKGAPESENLLSRMDSILLLTLFAGFLYYIYRNISSEKPMDDSGVEAVPVWKSGLFITIGIGALILGGKLVVDNAVMLAGKWGMSEKLIGLTIISIGTSLPELATSVVAALKRNTDIAIGNVIGSNIFNILLILGVSGLISPIPYDSVLNTDIYLLICGTVLLIVFMFTLQRKKLDRWEAAFMLIVYIGYTVFLIYRN